MTIGIEYRCYEKRKAACWTILIISTNKKLKSLTNKRMSGGKECETTDARYCWVRIANIKCCGQRVTPGQNMNILIQISGMPGQTSIEMKIRVILSTKVGCLLNLFLWTKTCILITRHVDIISLEKWGYNSSVYESKEKPAPQTPFYAHQGVWKLLSWRK